MIDSRPANRQRLYQGRWLCCLGLSLVWIGCGPDRREADLIIINGKEPETLDPALITGQADSRVASAIFEGLTRYNARTGEPEPGLAASWEISAGGTIYRFHLRADGRWSTGKPITAGEFVKSWRRVLEPEIASEYAGILYCVKNAAAFNAGRLRDPARLGFRALGPRSFQVTLNYPTPYFLDLCAFPTLAVVPVDFIRPRQERWLLARPLPVSGAYQLEQWRVNDRIRLIRNPRYWDAANVHCRTVDLLPIHAPSTALNLYQSGAADIVWDKELIPGQLIDLLKTRPDFHVYDFLATYFLRINVGRKPFGDPRVRKALAMTVDRKRIVSAITRGGEKPISQLVPPGIPGYRSPQGLGFDPDGARRLLAEAGFPDGQGFPRFDYLFNSSRLNEQIAVEIRAMWRRELGITPTLRQLEWKSYLAAQQAQDYAVSRSSWIGDYVDPNTFLEIFTSRNPNNRTGWKNAKYDRLIDQANRTVTPSRRMELLRQAERLLLQDAVPIVPIYLYVGMEYFDPERIRGVFPNLRGEHPIRAIRRIAPPTPARLGKARAGRAETSSSGSGK